MEENNSIINPILPDDFDWPIKPLKLVGPRVNEDKAANQKSSLKSSKLSDDAVCVSYMPRSESKTTN